MRKRLIYRKKMINEMNQKKSCVIAYEYWQMQCCGDPLKVGEQTELGIETYSEPYTLAGYHVDYNEEHHHGATAVAKGIIKQIKIVFVDKYADDNSEFCNLDNTFAVFDADYVDGWDDIEKCGHSYSDIFMYLVFMEDVTIDEL